MKIAEMEAGHDAYIGLEDKIRTMVAGREFPAVFPVCVAAFPHIVPAISYRKKRAIEPEIPEFLPFSVICKYAPPLFEHAVIESLFKFVNSTRVLMQSERNFLDSVVAAPGASSSPIASGITLKAIREFHRDVQTEFGVGQDDAVDVVEFWEKLGILERHPDERSYQLHFRTRLGTEVAGRCPQCGVRGKGRKGAIPSVGGVPEMRAEAYYHIEYRD